MLARVRSLQYISILFLLEVDLLLMANFEDINIGTFDKLRSPCRLIKGYGGQEGKEPFIVCCWYSQVKPILRDHSRDRENVVS